MKTEISAVDIAARIAHDAKRVCLNDSTAALVAYAQRSGAVHVTGDGVVYASTGAFTGRSPGDKFIVSDPRTEDSVWWENTNRMTQAHFDLLCRAMLDHLAGRQIFRQQLFAGADPEYRYNIDVLTQSAWHALFIRNLLIRPSETELSAFATNVTVVHAPDFSAVPALHGTKTGTCIALDFTRNVVLVCGTAYAGEIKKAVFSLFNFHAPARDVLPMHCSANVGGKGDTTIYFGLSGTGKTTLSSTADRDLVGDDEHGWSNGGIFNLEDGCYAKAINLTEQHEPEIFRAARQFGTVMENVTLNEATGIPDYADGSRTENTRIAYPLTAIANRVRSGRAPAPSNVVMLTADAFGVLPPIARLSPEQAVYYFLSGYTAKVAGTERGISEPQATFSACFGAPFMSRHPAVYGQLLADRLDRSGATCWLLNTGWTGGPYGIGQRMALKATRRMLAAALSGELDDVEFKLDGIFGLSIPVAVDGIDPNILQPANTWEEPKAYQIQAERLAAMFEVNFARLGPDARALTRAVALKSKVA